MRKNVKTKKSAFGIAVRVIGAVLAAALLTAVVYVLYVFGSYSRVPDNTIPEIVKAADNTLVPGKQYVISTYNIGFGAYSPDYSFFMDGGEYSRAYDEDEVIKNTLGAVRTVTGYNPDIMLFQEVDTDSTRSYHINQLSVVKDSFSGYSSVYAVNYNSAYLFYPFLSPIGASKSGILTLSRFTVASAIRRSLPLEEGVTKIVDLDRCYCITKLPVDNGKYLCVYNVHLSAYLSDATIRDAQIAMLCEDMKSEYDSGNYVICGGDFNQCMLENANELFKTESLAASWANQFPKDALPDAFFVCKPTVDVINPTCRNADIPYEDGVSFVTVIDGFIISDNVTLISLENRTTGFAYSDHDPVTMSFSLE